MSRNNEGFDDSDIDLVQFTKNDPNVAPAFVHSNNFNSIYNVNDEIEVERIRAREAKRLQRNTRVQFTQADIETEEYDNVRKSFSSPSKIKRSEAKPSKSLFGLPSYWVIYSRVITFWAPGSLLKLLNLKTKESQQAWREKIALVSIVVIMCASVGFLTFGLQSILCTQVTRTLNTRLSDYDVVINGNAYDISSFTHPAAPPTINDPINLLEPPTSAGKQDLSLHFQNPNTICKKILRYPDGFADQSGNVINVFPCSTVSIGQQNPPDPQDAPFSCHTTLASRRALSSLKSNPVSYEYEEVVKNKKYVIYNGAVLDLNRVSWLNPQITLPEEFNIFSNGSYGGQDITLSLANKDINIGKCMFELFVIGYLDTITPGCIASNIILYVSLLVILSAVFSKFFMAIYFGWFMSKELGKLSDESAEERYKRLENIENWANVNNHYGNEKIKKKYSVNYSSNYQRKKTKSFLPTQSRYSKLHNSDSFSTNRANPQRLGSRIYNPPLNNQSSFLPSQQNDSFNNLDNSNHNWPNSYGLSGSPPIKHNPYNGDSSEILHTFLVVTCYSEGARGIRTTLDSLAITDYPDSHKCLFVVCDGLIKGEGESINTPDICLSMMHDFVIPPDRVHAFSYVSIAVGSKRHNMAKLYAGYYSPGEDASDDLKSRRVPMVLIVKCGTPHEQNDSKVGNRGKRDSQVILMSFLQRVTFDERMTRLEYEMFNAIWNVTGVTPDFFEVVLMVDADTKVFPDSLGRMVSVMARDPMVMGLCGETKIANKRDSFTSMIQVFEYYISHHLSKAFESVFGGVTCLPGCFCMYRIKAPKGNQGYYAPVLANPDIVEHYSENVVNTLHKKNLLLLGEDRYLSTLMLRTFPKRKMMFVPSAVCKTIVPNTFKVLLSQRRRWINSTVHNLMELVLVNDLCGTFCFSMQFIIFMELVGTLVLPAAITFTLYLVIISFIVKPIPVLPLILLAIILGLPALLIGLTSRKLVYVGWMLIYLISLPIWNFVLPVYSYWHFDDFSWGETRKVQDETKDSSGHGDSGGEFDSSNIVMKRWADFESEKRKYAELIMATNPEMSSVVNENDHENSFVGDPRFKSANYYDTPTRISALFNLAQNTNDPATNAVFENIQQLGYHVPMSRTGSATNSFSADQMLNNMPRSVVPSIRNTPSGGVQIHRRTSNNSNNSSNKKSDGDNSSMSKLSAYRYDKNFSFNSNALNSSAVETTINPNNSFMSNNTNRNITRGGRRFEKGRIFRTICFFFFFNFFK
ncbi:Chitin synthase 4 [Smittium culicis]|uniref:chitin synthase n=1 Tax=Smittium culicis TaxID=133412 RepID=A0A1R1Y8T7_9FUNG|nr:Chitin synthase 4 [Smittium culicis]